MSTRILTLISILIATVPGRADVPPPAGVFTEKCLLGTNPWAYIDSTRDQYRICESDNWRSAINKCPPNGKPGFPALRVGPPRVVTYKDLQGGAQVDAATLELDFECGTHTPMKNAFACADSTKAGDACPVDNVQCDPSRCMSNGGACSFLRCTSNKWVKVSR